MKSEMIRLLPIYHGVESENPYSFMRDFEDVCSAFLSTGSPPPHNLFGFISFYSKGESQNLVSFSCTQLNLYMGIHAK